MLGLCRILQETILSVVSILFDTILPLGSILRDTILLLGPVLYDTIFSLGMVLCDTILPFVKVLYKTVFITVLCDTILPLGKVLCDTVLSFGCDVEWYDKESGLTNLFYNTIDEKDVIVDHNDNRYWREERVCVNVVKDIVASGEIIFGRENESWFDS